MWSEQLVFVTLIQPLQFPLIDGQLDCHASALWTYDLIIVSKCCGWSSHDLLGRSWGLCRWSWAALEASVDSLGPLFWPLWEVLAALGALREAESTQRAAKSGLRVAQERPRVPQEQPRAARKGPKGVPRPPAEAQIAAQDRPLRPQERPKTAR